LARLSGVDLPREKRIEIALTYIYGIGRTRSAETLAATGISPDVRVRDLTEDDLVKLKNHIDENYKVEGDLRREVQSDIRRKIEIGCPQGLPHRRRRTSEYLLFSSDGRSSAKGRRPDIRRCAACSENNIPRLFGTRMNCKKTTET